MLMDDWASQPDAKAALSRLLLPSVDLGRSESPSGPDCFPTSPKARLE